MSDEADPRCPNCGEEVSRYASICLHCYEDLVAADEFESAPPPEDSSSTTVDDPEVGAASDADVSSTSDVGASGPVGEATAGSTSESSVSETVAEEFEAITRSRESTPTSSSPSDSNSPSNSVSSTATSSASSTATSSASVSSEAGEQTGLLDPDGIADNTLTIVVAIVAGLVIGVLGTFALAIITESTLGFLVGFVGWLGATAYLARQRTVQGAITRGLRGVALVLLLFPFIWFSPAMEGGTFGGRVIIFVVTLVIIAIPAALLGGVSLLVAQTIPEEETA